MATFRFRFAPPTASHGARGNLALTINADHSVGAGHKGQVFIQSAEPMAAPVHPAMARVDTRFRPLVRVDLAAPKP